MPHTRASAIRRLKGPDLLGPRAAALRKVENDPSIKNMLDLAAAMSTNLKRLDEILGPEKRRVSYLLAERRNGPAHRRRRDHEWRDYTRKGRHRRAREEKIRELQALPTWPEVNQENARYEQTHALFEELLQ